MPSPSPAKNLFSQKSTPKSKAKPMQQKKAAKPAA